MQSFFWTGAKQCGVEFPLDRNTLLQKDSRFDFGPGLGRCGLCRSFPHSNRGCRTCGTRLCKSCSPKHRCKLMDHLTTVVQLKQTIEPEQPNEQLTCAPCTNRLGSFASFQGSHGQPLPMRRLVAPSRYTSLLQERNFKSLGSNDLAAQVQLPFGASKEEWIAVNTIEFFNEFTLLAGALTDTCTAESCPCMSAGPYVFAWCDGQEFMEPTEMSAPRYIEHLLLWVEQRLADEHFLPTAAGIPFPTDYHADMRVIYKRLLRIYAHTFYAHLQEMIAQEADAHLNHSFKHFMYFAREFDLLAEEDILLPCVLTSLEDRHHDL